MPIQFLSLQGTGGTAVPYERRNAPYTLTSIATNPQDSLRLKRYEEHWRFYQGLHWSFQREDGEPLVTANYCRTIVNKKASWLVGKGMHIKTPEAMTEITKPVLEEVWKYNNKLQTLMAMAVTGGVTGDVFFLVTYQPPSNAMLMVNPYTEGKTRIRLLGSHQVYPYWNPLNMEELQRVRIITEVLDSAPVELGDGRRTPMTVGSLGAQRKRRYIEDITPDSIAEGWEGEGAPVVRKNDLGEIPLVHIVNEVFPNEYYGLSDLDGVIDLQREFNEKMTDVSDIVNYHSAPITIMTGAKARNLERGPKSLWAGLPSDAKVYNLELGGDLGAAHKYIELVRQVLFDISNLPEGSLGRIQPISNTSAVALQTAFQPLLEATDRKRPNYEDGLQKVNYFILRYNQLVTGEKYPVDICKNCGGRIVEITEKLSNGATGIARKCFLVNPQTLDFLDPEDVEVNIKRKFSYGVETRLMPFKLVKAEFNKESASYWDPAPEKDLQEEADENHGMARKVQEHHAGQAQAQAEHGAVVQDLSAEAAPAPKPGEPAPPPKPPTPAQPPAPGTTPLPKALDKPPEVKPEQLAPHDMDIPEEPETVHIVVKNWNSITKEFEEQDLGNKLVVPTGCKRPRYLSPYTTSVHLRTPIPRNKQEDFTLYQGYLTTGVASRAWVREHMDEDFDGPKLDKEIADDIPFVLALQGKPDGSAVQGAGAAPGSNNGAPLPPGPGPGRGNKLVPGDNGASPPANAAAGQKPPPNAAPGSPV